MNITLLKAILILFIQKGKLQQYKLGQYLRRRYNKLIGHEYNSNVVYTQSTDTDRTIMSALSNLAALFPPLSDDEIWCKNINWQPIPVHTVPYNLDGVLSAGKPCPKYQTAYEKYLNESSEVKRIYDEYSELFPFLTEKIGSNIKTITDVYWLYNTLQIEKEQNKTLVNTFYKL